MWDDMVVLPPNYLMGMKSLIKTLLFIQYNNSFMYKETTMLVIHSDVINNIVIIVRKWENVCLIEFLNFSMTNGNES